MKAYYDEKPQVIEAVGNGSYLYRYDMQEQTVADEEQAERTQWQCEEVTVWNKPTANSILEAVITDRWQVDYEQKLINDYNGAKLGVYVEEEATEKIAAYTAYLKVRAQLKAQVNKDCADMGVK